MSNRDIIEGYEIDPEDFAALKQIRVDLEGLAKRAGQPRNTAITELEHKLAAVLRSAQPIHP